MRKKTVMSPPAVGASSLLVIFAVLCLTVFALLSISTVQADERLGDHAAAAVTGYYRADCQAELILAQIRSGTIPEGVTEENGVYAYYCAISDTQALSVAVAVEESNYSILRWQAISTADWQADDRLPVWDGSGA